MDNKLNLDEDINYEADNELEIRNLEFLLGFAFLAVWALSIILYCTQN